MGHLLLKCKKTPSLVFAIFALLTTSVPAFASEADRLQVAFFPFPPLLHYAENGEFSGTKGETVKRMCALAKVDCDFIMLPTTRAYSSLENGAVDAMITIRTSRLADCCLESEWKTPWAAGFFSSRRLENIPKKPTDLINQTMIMVNGMRSPYEFAPRLQEWEDNREVTVLKPHDISAGVKMFLKKRADLLWGSEEFAWYFDKIDPQATHTFLPVMVTPVVIWVNKGKEHLLTRLNKAYDVMQRAEMLEAKNLLRPNIMKQHYKDAPFDD